MPAKPPKRPKDASKEELDEYSQKLEQYFKEKEQELADQQRQYDEAAAEVDRERTNLQLKDREAEEERERNVAGDTPTPNVMEIGAFLLCYFFTKALSGPPWDKRAPALSSSQDQCAWAPSSGTTPTQFTLIL